MLLIKFCILFLKTGFGIKLDIKVWKKGKKFKVLDRSVFHFGIQ